MKVISQGNWKNPWSKQYICVQEQCGAELVVEESDVKAPDFSHLFHFVCCVCGRINTIDAKDLPHRIQSLLNEKRRPPQSSGSWRD